LKNNVFFATKV